MYHQTDKIPINTHFFVCIAQNQENKQNEKNTTLLKNVRFLRFPKPLIRNRALTQKKKSNETYNRKNEKEKTNSK